MSFFAAAVPQSPHPIAEQALRETSAQKHKTIKIADEIWINR